jgi:YD repeat-containing protein
MTGPNGDKGTTTYDSYGRPSQTTTPDGGVTTYTYTYSPGASTQTATLDGCWQTTTVDGFGRTIQVHLGCHVRSRVVSFRGQAACHSGW